MTEERPLVPGPGPAPGSTGTAADTQPPAGDPGTGQGWVADRAFHWPVRIYYGETDAAGVVYHAQYLTLAERARTEMLRHHGLPLTEFKALTGCVFVVHWAEIDYRAPGFLDDRLILRVICEQPGGSRMPVTHQVWRDTTLLATVRVRLVCVSELWRPARVPPILSDRLSPVLRPPAA